MLDRQFVFDLTEATVTTPFKVKFDLRRIDCWTLVETFLLDIHRDLEVRGRTVFDVGAQAGDTALYFSSNGASKVYAVEPVQANYDAMLCNLELNPGLRGAVAPVKAAVGSTGKLTLEFTLGAGGLTGTASGFAGRGLFTEEVESLSLGDLLSKLGLNSVDVLKMDCKGCEWLITANDLGRVNEAVKIEWTGGSEEKVSRLLKILTENSFKPRVYMHNPGWWGTLTEHGTVIAERSVPRV